MSNDIKHIVGTSGYSFTDWVGSFYPSGTRQKDMFALYSEHFEAVELNFTFYRLEAALTLDKLARTSPAHFQFWVKANRKITHEPDRDAASQFLQNLQPMSSSGKLSGVLLQFPQSFRRTVDSRKYLAQTLDDLACVDLAVEFRHSSWDHSSTVTGLAERNVTLVIPDCPAIANLYRPEPTATTKTGYLRLHSRDPDKWYAGMAKRYDYNYSDEELKSLAKSWSQLPKEMKKVFAFFNNCHHGQAAQNAEAFRRILGQIGSDGVSKT